MDTNHLLQGQLGEIAAEVSGQRALQTIRTLFPSDRRGDFAAFAETAELAADLLAGAGLRDVTLIPHPADGVHGHEDWVVPQAWDVFGGSLEIVAPQRLRRTVVRHLDFPLCIAMWSAATPPAGLEAELVDWDRLPEPRAAEGKIVLTGRKVREVAADALAAGALGIVCDAPQQADMPPSARYWENYSFCPRNTQGGWAFVLSPREGEALRADLARMRAAPLILRATVNANLYDGEVNVVTGLLPGTEGEEEVLLLAHLYEIGANDNMSGVAAVIEAARALNTLVTSGRLGAVGRAIRVLLCYEQYGSLAYLDGRRGTPGRIVAGLNADMVGEDQALCGSVLRLDRTPAATPSYTNDLLAHLLAEQAAGLHPPLHWREHSFAVHDGFISDPTVGVPTPTLLHQPDRFYHSDADTPDKCSPQTLASVAALIAGYARIIGGAGTVTAGRLAALAAHRAKLRLLAELRRVEETRRVPWGTLQERIAWLYEREALTVRSAGSLVPASDREEFAEQAKRLTDHLAELFALSLEPLQELPLATPAREEHPEVAAQAQGLIPGRLGFGTPTMAALAREAQAEFAEAAGGSFPYSDRLCCALFWADGRATVREVRENVAHETGWSDLGAILRMFAGLARHGYVELLPGGAPTPAAPAAAAP